MSSNEKAIDLQPRFQKGLLLQFILSEFIEAKLEIKKINELFLPINNEVIQDLFFSLKVGINKLIGSSYQYMRFFSFTNEHGLLTKLRNNCTFLLQIIDLKKKNLIDIQKESQKAWILGLKSLDYIHLLEKKKLLKESHFQSIQSNLRKVEKAIEKLGILLADLILEFSQDENVLYFLLKNYKDLKSIYGMHFVEELFQKLFANGLDQGISYIQEKYHLRGFTHLHLSIENAAKEVFV